MKSIDNSAVINYTLPQNILATSVAFTYVVGSTDTVLTVTDNTVYPSGDSRETVTVTVADKYGHLKEYNFGDSTDHIAIDITLDGFNDNRGLALLVTVASALRHYKDGSAFHVGLGKTSGNFTMEI